MRKILHGVLCLLPFLGIEEEQNPNCALTTRGWWVPIAETGTLVIQ